ncbi:amino acid ABC transporter permease [Rhodovibrionaceae bacterium A322]
MLLSVNPPPPRSLKFDVILSVSVAVVVLALVCFSSYSQLKPADNFPSLGSLISGFGILSAALAGCGFFLLLRCSMKWQLALVWVALAALFMVFFYSFDLNLPFVAEKLPFLISKGVFTTIYVSLISIFLAFALALVGSVAKLSGNGIAMGVAAFYTSFFRGVPLLVQLFLVYLGLPQIGIIIDPIPAGVAALSLCYGAYMTEIFRAGIQSIDRGQWEASAALGLKTSIAFRKIILPQAFKIIVPPTGNSFIAMLKDSSLVSVVGVWDLMYVARAQGRSDFRILEMLITAAIIYWLLSIVLELIQSRIERHYRQSEQR